MKIVFNKKVFIWTVIAACVVLAITLGLVFGLKSKNDDTVTLRGAVVSNGAGCADIGSHMLEDGGSAVDAAIATLICEGVVVPQSMGLGGGFVATIYTKSTGKVATLIARESAPAAAHRDMYVGKNITGALAGAVPGELLGYWELHKRYGRLPWKVLFQPTIDLCKNGHLVSNFLARVLVAREDRIRAEPTMAEVFIKTDDGSLYKEGDTLKRTVLGQTLEYIAEHGIGAMYDGGEIGKMFAEDIQAMGGIITEQDLRDYRVSWDDTHHVVANVTGGYTLYTTPLPSSGAILAFILNVMSDLFNDNQEIYWQRTIETFKHAYGQRTNLGDLTNELDMAATINETFNKLLSQDFADYVRTLIHDDKTFDDVKYYGANFTIEEDHGTANMAVLAPNGDAVVVTSTVNNYFGAKVRSRRTGIILNDEMDDFSTPGVINGFGVPASPANYIKPGKRPMSSMCPAIILDRQGNVRMLVGAAGGTKITTSVATAIMKYLIFNETLEQAVNDGRLHHQLAPMYIDVEAEVPQNIKSYLTKVGHKLNIVTPGSGFAAVTTIGAREQKLEPFFDRRRVGSVALVHQKNKMQH